MATTTTRLATAPVSAMLQAGEIDRARHFYRDTLGFEVDDVMPDGFMVKAGMGTSFTVYHSEFSRPAEYTVAMWTVDDLRATMADLRDRGVTFEEYDFPNLKTVQGIAEDDTSLAAWFKDSEGNIISLMQMK